MQKEKVLWVASFELPIVSQISGNKENVSGGWISSLLEEMKSNQRYEIAICCPSNSVPVGKYTQDNIEIYTLETALSKAYNRFIEIIEDYKPEILHLWGAEVDFSLPAASAFNNMARTVVHIQGCMNRYVYHFNSGLPWSTLNIPKLGEVLRRTSIPSMRLTYKRRMKSEDKVMHLCGNAMGRTRFDENFCKDKNNRISYFRCGEIMRKSFYSPFNVTKNHRHEILFCNANNHFKGFHILVDACGMLKKKYADFSINVVGSDIYDYKTGFLTDKRYWSYLRKKIDKNGLKENIHFLGTLNEKSMYEIMKKSDVFISASACENSSNAICEAMLTGLPVIASDVGGNADLIEHNKTGFLYPFDAPYMLSYYIELLFSHSETAEMIAANARTAIEGRCSPEVVRNELLNVYNTILESGDVNENS